MESIHVEQVSKAIGNCFRLGPLDLSVAPSEILGIVGPEGAGKTTLLKMLWGFIRPDAGSISIFGMRPHLNQLRLRRRVGYLSHNSRLHPEGTVKQFIDYVGAFYDGWNESHSSRLLADFAIDPNAKMQSLSRGDRQKVAIVSIASHQPAVLLLDEPTSGIDRPGRLAMFRLLRRIAKQQQVSMVISCPVSDDLDYIADSILMLKDGRAIEYASVLQQ